MKEKRLTTEEMQNMKIAHLEEEIEKLKIALIKLGTDLELNGLEIHITSSY
jgi:ribosomal protein L29